MSASAPKAMSSESSRIVKTVFLALVLDLLAFTLPLPLFPRLIDYYTSQESSNPNSFLSRVLSLFRSFRSLASNNQSSTLSSAAAGNKRWDVVLLGGALGSVFSLCQCIISPSLGSLSDKYGRKPVLLLTMLGNILSAFIWLKSTTFSTYLISRLIGGLSEGNVQLSQAIISDVTTPETRSKSLALVGIAFSVCFTFGPSIGAYFASRSLPTTASPNSPDKSSRPVLNVYAFPALVSLVLLCIETFYLYVSLPETRGYKSRVGLKDLPQGGSGTEQKTEEKEGGVKRESVEVRKERLRKLGRLHGLFLLFFSGAEFTLTFLTYDLFFATNKQNGMLLSYIGVLSSLLQGGFVRPRLTKHKTSELTFTQQGIYSCTVSLALMAILPLTGVRDSKWSSWVLYAIATGLSYTSATAVTGMMGAAAACCDDVEDEADQQGKLPRGKALGRFRSAGQLGRAIGPLLATATYWTQGPSVTYTIGALALGTLAWSMGGMVSEEVRRKAANKSR